MGKSNYQENVTLDARYGSGSPATVYVALVTSASSDAGMGTEVSGGNYSRAAVTNNSTNFPAASGGSKSNGTPINFPTPSASWGTVVGFVTYDASSGGNAMDYAALTTNKTIDSGDTVSFPIGSLVITED